MEDLGRRHAALFGIPPGGAFDPVALVAANRLLGNPDGAAGLEITLGGPTLCNTSEDALQITWVGADCGAMVVRGAERWPLPRGTVIELRPGDALEAGFARDGARAWIAVHGGIATAPVLGSRSTCAAGGFGGLEGRPLRAGDVLPVAQGQAPPTRSTWQHPDLPGDLVQLRIVPGPQVACFATDPIAALESTLWWVAPDSDRTGLRLAPLDPTIRVRLAGVAGIPPEGTTLGAVQVPGAGEAIVLGPDRPVTGGYAKPALVIAADLGRLAQLRPRDRVRFLRIDLEAACRLAEQRWASLAALASSGTTGALS